MITRTMKGKTSIWNGRTWLWFVAFVAVAVSAQTSQMYDLPPFSIVLNVDESETSLITFEDRLIDVVQQHLIEFFEEKVDIPSYGDGQVELVALSASHVWKELGQAQSNRFAHKYEVQSDFTCKLELSYNSTNGRDTHPSSSIMNLLLIEAFQGDNYWDLVHTFLRDTVLKDITGVQVTVVADGYVHNNGEKGLALEEEPISAGDDWTPAMTAGVIFAGVLVFSITLMWTYLCCFARGAILLQCVKFGRRKLKEKADSVTDDAFSTSTLNPDDDASEGRWLDAWAEAVTSIPLREPVKTRKLKKQPTIRHPAQHHSSYLNCIEEADDETSTVCSVESSRTHASKRQWSNASSSPEPGTEGDEEGSTASRVRSQPGNNRMSQTQLESISEMV